MTGETELSPTPVKAHKGLPLLQGKSTICKLSWWLNNRKYLHTSLAAVLYSITSIVAGSVARIYQCCALGDNRDYGPGLAAAHLGRAGRSCAWKHPIPERFSMAGYPTCPLPLVGDFYPETPVVLSCWGFSDPAMQCPGAFAFPVLFCGRLESVEPLFLALAGAGG